MPEIAPLRPLRYALDALPRVIAPPYDVVGPAERAALAARSPYNVVHLDLPEGEDDGRYARAAATLARFVAEGALREERTPLLLRYEQTFDPPPGAPGGRVTRRGLFALVRAEPYEARAVLPHERTLSGPKADRYALFVATRTALSPVFLLYTDRSGDVAAALEGAAEEAAFRTDDGVEHRLARLEDPAAMARVGAALAAEPLLIADGHHRYETAVAYAAAVDRARAAEGLPPAGERAAYRYVLAFLADADDPGLVVFPTHRLVVGLPELDPAAFLRQAAATFEVSDAPADVASASRDLEAAGAAHGMAFGVRFRGGRAARLALRRDVDLTRHPGLAGVPPVLRDVDVAVLHALLLEGALGITREAQAAQTHLRYVKVAAEGAAAVDRGEADALFLLNATPVDAVRRACLAGEVMPQKSTFFYPKVPTGLVLHPLDPDRTV